MIRVGILAIAKNGEEILSKEAPYRIMIVKRYFEKIACEVVECKIIENKQNSIEEELKYMSDNLKLDLIITIGGIEYYEKDVVPEATKNVIYKDASGIAEGIRYFCLKMNKRIILSRGVAGIRNKTLIVNLSDKPKLITLSLDFFIETIIQGVRMVNPEV